MILRFLSARNVHTHGIIHAIGITIWIYCLGRVSVMFLASNPDIADSPYFPLKYLTSIAKFVYLVFAISLFVRRSGVNTILRNIHTGVIISFIYPFFLALLLQYSMFGEISLRGIQPTNMVNGMILTIPAACVVYLYYYFRGKFREDEKRNDILDEDFLMKSKEMEED